MFQIREKSVYSTPWRQNGARSTPGPDGEVRQIMSQPHLDSTPKRTRYLASPRNVFSPGKNYQICIHFFIDLKATEKTYNKVYDAPKRSLYLTSPWTM